jgi:NADH:ubiquinone oxidoreductase subunit F (NADH-binding)
MNKHEMYIYRETEYRRTIELLKQQIEENSKKSLVMPKEIVDEGIELEGGVRLEL